MLRGLFDTLDESSYVESKDALLQLLQTRVWPLLGISQHIHNTIYAWTHFRQFAVTGESLNRILNLLHSKGDSTAHHRSDEAVLLLMLLYHATDNRQSLQLSCSSSATEMAADVQADTLICCSHFPRGTLA